MEALGRPQLRHGAAVAVVLRCLGQGQGHKGHILLLCGQRQDARHAQSHARPLHLPLIATLQRARKRVPQAAAQFFRRRGGKRHLHGRGQRLGGHDGCGDAIAGKQGVARGAGLQGSRHGFARAFLAVAQVHGRGDGAGAGQSKGHVRPCGEFFHILQGKTPTADGAYFQVAGVVLQSVREGLHHAEFDAVEHQQGREHGGQAQHGAG